jgi:hypothetical protein
MPNWTGRRLQNVRESIEGSNPFTSANQRPHISAVEISFGKAAASVQLRVGAPINADMLKLANSLRSDRKAPLGLGVQVSLSAPIQSKG